MRVYDIGFRVYQPLGSRFEVRSLGSGFRVWGLGFRVKGAGFRISLSGLRVQSPGLRVWGSKFGV